MILTNTSVYAEFAVRPLVLFGIGDITSHDDVEVHVKNTSTCAFAGMAYCGIPRIANCDCGSRYLVTLRIGNQIWFPVSNNTNLKLKSVPHLMINDWEEALVYLTAHEFRHIEQFRRGGSMSEVECELSAIEALKRFRETQ